jgi:adenylate cyclase
MTSTAATTGGRHRVQPIAVAALALPVLGLGLLLARPELDVHWQHQPSHFWLVLGTAALSVALALATNEAASRRADARIVLVSLAFLVSAGFLGLHALATPGVLLEEPNAGFALATPVGLGLASVLAAAATTRAAGPDAEWLLRLRTPLRWGVLAILAAWAAVSLLELPPLNGPPEEELGTLGALLAVGTVALYGFAAWRFAAIGRRRASAFAVAIAASFVLLAEAMLAVALSRSWHLSWWEWHLLMAGAFGLIALSARAEYRRTGSLVATFGPAYLSATLERIDRWHGRAIGDLAAADARGEDPTRLLDSLRREGASADELALMQRAASEIRAVDELFRPYLPQSYAAKLRRGQDVTRPVERSVSVVFADLAGFTAYSETHAPTEVVAMLNAFWAAVVPIIDLHGGAIEHFAGDGILVQFGAVADQPDHAARAVLAALDLLAATDVVAAEHPGWPRFRAGINSGTAVVGPIGAAGRRSLATIGDTTNLGARLAGVGEPGQAVIGPGTRAAIGRLLAAEEVVADSIGTVAVKGKRDRVPAWIVRPGPRGRSAS